MSELETRVQPIFQPLMRGVESTITTDQQLAIQRWTLKTAIMYEYRESRRKHAERFFKPRDRRTMFENRTVDAHVFLFAGHYVGPYSLWTSDADIPLNIHFEGERTDFPAYSFTFAIGQLALQLFAFRYPVESGARQIQFALPGIYKEATVQISPVRWNRQWPPEVKFDQPGIIEWSKTWRTFPAAEPPSHGSGL